MNQIEPNFSFFVGGDNFKSVFINLTYGSASILAAAVSGVGYYIVYRTMKSLKIEHPPFLAYGILLSILSGVLLILFGDWGRDSSLLGFIFGLVEGLYAINIAPFLTAVLVFNLYPKRKVSGFHFAAFIASAIYTGMMLVIFVGWLSVRLFVKPVDIN